MDELHFILQGLLTGFWIYAIYKLIKNRRYMPLNLFGVMLAAGVLMLYVISVDIIQGTTIDDVMWRRWEWYGAKTLVALSYIKVVNMSSKINSLLNCFSKKKG